MQPPLTLEPGLETCPHAKNPLVGLIQKHSESLHNPDLSNYSLSFPVTLAFLHIFQPRARSVAHLHLSSAFLNSKNNAETGPREHNDCAQHSGGAGTECQPSMPVVEVSKNLYMFTLVQAILKPRMNNAQLALTILPVILSYTYKYQRKLWIIHNVKPAYRSDARTSFCLQVLLNVCMYVCLYAWCVFVSTADRFINHLLISTGQAATMKQSTNCALLWPA